MELRKGGGAMTVVYLDSVFALNALVDYLLLAAAARLADLPVCRGRWVLGALLGGVYAAAVFLPGLGWLSRWPAHLVSGCAMTAAAFGRRRLLRRFLLVGWSPADLPGRCWRCLC
jgi:stage II sporulation protein GA (sporulation sigma-E factor processing peptidase)